MLNIRILVLDVDGTLTDGRLFYDEQGRAQRAFHIHDGLAIRGFQHVGGRVVLLTAKSSPAVSSRAADLGIEHVIQASRDKLADLSALLGQLDADFEHVAAMGDDLPDLPVLRRCGYPMAPANAVAEVRAAARYVTKRSGGHGAVREAVEHLLRADGRWHRVLELYGAADAK